MIYVAGTIGGGDAKLCKCRGLIEVSGITHNGREPTTGVGFDSVQASAPCYIGSGLQPSHGRVTITSPDSIVSQDGQDSRLADPHPLTPRFVQAREQDSSAFIRPCRSE